MRTVGIIGGMSDYAVEFYCRSINARTMELKVRSDEVVTHECSAGRIGQLAREGRWDDVVAEMVDAAREMRRAGADFVVIPSFSLHRVAEVVAKESGVPLLRMDDCVVKKVAKLKCQRIAVLSAGVAGEEFLQTFRKRLVDSEGHNIKIYGGAATIEYSPITLANQPYSSEQRRKHLWTYLEETQDVEDYVEAIFNCSAEMTRMIGMRTVLEPLKTKNGLIPIMDAVDLHVRAIVSACRNEQ